MSLANSASHYGSVTKTFHWLTALMIFTVIPLGLIANGIAEDIRNPDIAATEDSVARAAQLFSLHKTIGISVFFISLARILWAIRQPKPRLLNAEVRHEAFAAEMVHWLLYGALLLVPLTGWIHHAATTGFAPILWPFGQGLPLVPKSETVADIFASLHMAFEKVLLVSILLHVAGALKHHVIDRDMTLLRMLPGRRDLPTPTDHAHSPLPILAALGIWITAMGYGVWSGGGTDHNHSVPHQEELSAVQSDWQVTGGSLSISVSQLGSPVAGEFSDWTAAIDFDDPANPGPAGQVNVVISIPSLTLGSVTAQAMGADFFDAETFPQATFNAEIQKTETGFVAEGPLTLKGISVPISLPFELTLEGDQANMTGTLNLDRLDFGIGQSMPDESSLGFSVVVTVALTAKRAPPDA